MTSFTGSATKKYLSAESSMRSRLNEYRVFHENSMSTSLMPVSTQ